MTLDAVADTDELGAGGGEHILWRSGHAHDHLEIGYSLFIVLHCRVGQCSIEQGSRPNGSACRLRAEQRIVDGDRLFRGASAGLRHAFPQAIVVTTGTRKKIGQMTEKTHARNALTEDDL